MNLLLLSSSRVADTNYLQHAESLIIQHLGSSIKRVLFIPYAGVTISHDDYEKMAGDAFAQFGYTLESIHHKSDPKLAIEQAEAIAVGGGNTFCLLNRLYQLKLLEPLQRKMASGAPYIGWSAGSNICAPSIRTTNDMPIIEPPSFNALNLVPFQVNPHYIDGNPPGHRGETREQRIMEFLTIAPTATVIGLPEGTALKRSGDSLSYIGNKAAFLFTALGGKQSIAVGADINHLLHS